MSVPTSEVGYTLTMPRREDHGVHKGHVVALEKKSALHIRDLSSHYCVIVEYPPDHGRNM